VFTLSEKYVHVKLKRFIAPAFVAKKFETMILQFSTQPPIATYCIAGCVTANNYQLRACTSCLDPTSGHLIGPS